METNLYNHQASYYVPDPVNRYKGAQVIINSDRLVFNAKTDSVLMYSDKTIGFSTTGGIYFDTGTNTKTSKNPSRFVVNSPEIYLGLKDDAFNEGRLPTQRMVLGNELRKWLNTLLKILDGIFDDLEDRYNCISSQVGTPTIPDSAGNASMIKTRKRQTKRLRDIIAVNNLDQLLPEEKCGFLSKRIKVV